MTETNRELLPSIDMVHPGFATNPDKININILKNIMVNYYFK